MTDAEFIKNLKGAVNRDAAALEKIYLAYFKKLFGTALFVLRDRDDAYDAATDVILKLCDYSGAPAAYATIRHFSPRWRAIARSIFCAEKIVP